MRLAARVGVVLCVLYVLRVVIFAQTFNITCSGDITATMNSDIAAAANGDTINISAGSCTMSSLNTITNLNITIQGAGKANTIITANTGFGVWQFTGSNVPTFHLTGFTLQSTTQTGGALTVYADQSASWRGAFHIDHMAWTYTASGADGLIQFFGPIYGVIDHTDFTQDHEAVLLTSLAVNTEACYSGVGSCVVSDAALAGGWALSQPYQPGTANSGNYLYIEDCTFAGGPNSGVAAIDTFYSGGRVVFRHNTLTNSALFAHWTSQGNVNSLWWEIYNNKLNWTNTPTLAPFTARMEGGGTGLFYNNTVAGNWNGNNIFVLTDIRESTDLSTTTGPPLLNCDGTHNWDGDAGDTNGSTAAGWPCLVQVGRNADKTIAQIQAGNRESSFPMYFWNNGPQDKCYNAGAAGAACDNTFVPSGGDVSATGYIKSTAHSVTGGGYGQGDVDYCVNTSQPTGCGTHTLTYTPFTYPHPLAGGGGTTPPLMSIQRLRHR